MTKPTFWGKLLTELQKEHRISERELARVAKVNRGSIRRFKKGHCSMTIDRLERILAVLGHVIEPMSVNPDDKEGKTCHTPHPASANVAA